MHTEDERSIDLHAHTTASDGDHSPAELVRHAAECGLRALAVTDHDTTDGVLKAMEAGKRYGVEVVPGIELSAEIKVGQCHLLGYLIDPISTRLQTRLEEVRAKRSTRNDEIVAKLQALGYDITLEEVKAVSGGLVVARPHFARVLWDKGYVGSTQEAFDTLLAKGAKAYVERVRLQQKEAIELIHAAGGVAVLAHPNNLKRDEVGTEAEIARLQSDGLDGIEARYNRHTPEDTARYLALAERLGLLTTGGSDFHGPSVKPTVYLGHVEGERPAPYALLAALKARQRNYSRR